MKTVYLDNAATTQVCPEAVEAAVAAMTEGYFNPSSRYPQSIQAGKRMAEHREMIAKALGCKANEVVFTSCGTESDNWAIKGAAELSQRKGKHIITTAIEHHAVLNPIAALEKQGYEVTYLKPTAEGCIRLEELEQAIRPDTVLVSMMLVNNELGSILPVKEAVQILRRRNPAALFHCDAVQAFLKVPFTVRELGVDLLSVSGHKVHAPKGIGALYLRSGIQLPPMILGGGQENGLRSGTEPTAQIAAFAAACRVGLARRDVDIAHMQELKSYVLERLRADVPQVTPVVSGGAPHVLALTMAGYKSEVLVRVLGDRGICVSAGSACHKGKPSHVYGAMPLNKAQRDGAFRISFSGDSSREDVDLFISALQSAAKMLFPSMS